MREQIIARDYFGWHQESIMFVALLPVLVLTILGSFSSTLGSRDIGLICQELWDADTNSLRYGIDFDIDLQFNLRFSNSDKDMSKGKLFTRVDETRLNTRTWRAFKALLNNYVAKTGNTEVLTKQDKKENEEFLTAVMATKTMKKLHSHLKLKGLAPTSESLFKFELKKIWFYFYRRNAYRDSSGFEHVFLGELKDINGVTAVIGFHNWLQFYMEEKRNNLANYYGYYKVRPWNEPASIKLQLSWKSHLKKVTGFFLGTSPEFELALYTACFKLKPNQSCQCNIGGQTIAIKTYRSPRSTFVGTAFPLL